MKRLVIFFMTAFLLCGCGKTIDVVDSIDVEAGTELSTDVNTYATLPDGIDANDVTVNLEEVDINKLGSYNAYITYGDKEYKLTIHVIDTTYPSAELRESYTIAKPGTFIAADYVENVEDATETNIFFLNSIEKRSDLTVMNDEEVESNALSGSEEVIFSEEMSFVESEEITDDGIYDCQIAIKDEAGNMKVFNYTFYIDGTPPVIEGLEDGDMEVVETEESYNFNINMHVVDNFDGDITYEESTVADMLDYGDYIDMKVTATDRAGNEVSGQANLTYPEDIMEQLYAQQMEELRQILQENGSIQNKTESTKQSSITDGLNRALAEEAFGYVNQQREENGLSALAWDESIYELACVRAQEIASSFSHTRPDGTEVAFGENIARCNGAQAVVNGWMNSEGHRDNILTSYYNIGVMACYCSQGNEYWVNLFGL